MIAQARVWWHERSERERWMLGAMFAILLLLLIWLTIVKPIERAVERAQQRHVAAIESVSLVETKITALEYEQAKTPFSGGADMTSAVRLSAEGAGFTLARADPADGRRVMISIVTAKSPALFAWIDTLDNNGLFVERATVRPNSDATIGFDATLRARTP